ncbi:hypothetical protein [Trebonia kvetii]|uniref:hypothetical protein n=1 Tax=Trebonia kvetii TaxID=2480626 RepID=UPI001652378B|nr:hypothetical protein [Trebonia kvetii]
MSTPRRLAGAGWTTRGPRAWLRITSRIHSIERDAFTESSGYPPGSQVAGIPLRDRVWLDIQLGPALSTGGTLTR